MIALALKNGAKTDWDSKLEKYLKDVSNDISENTKKNLSNYLRPWVVLLTNPASGGYPSSNLLKMHLEGRHGAGLAHASKKKIAGAIKKFTNYILPDCHLTYQSAPFSGI